MPLRWRPASLHRNSVEGTVNLRGYSSKNILVLVDGQQMNTAWNGDVDWNMIPVENIHR